MDKKKNINKNINTEKKRKYEDDNYEDLVEKSSKLSVCTIFWRSLYFILFLRFATVIIM
jgi:hypothetical protein